MPVMDEFKEEREALKHAPLKQKLSYFVYYYKWHVVIGILALALAVTFAVQIATRKDTGLYVCLLNAAEPYDTSAYVDAFASYAGVDLDTYALLFDSTMTIGDELDQETVMSAQRLSVYIAAGDLDVMVADMATMESQANNQYFSDLRTILTPQQLEKYQSAFYYVDMAAIREKEAAVDRFDADYVPVYPDPRKPEEMEEPIPVGVLIQGENPLKDNYRFQGDELVLSIFQNTSHLETALKFLDFVMQ